MSAEWLRRNPALFAGVEEQKQNPLDLTDEYLDLCGACVCVCVVCVFECVGVYL